MAFGPMLRCDVGREWADVPQAKVEDVGHFMDGLRIEGSLGLDRGELRSGSRGAQDRSRGAPQPVASVTLDAAAVIPCRLS